MFYIAAAGGFVLDGNKQADPANNIIYTRNIRYAKSFDSWDQADRFMKDHKYRSYYAILSTTVYGDTSVKTSS